MQNGSDYAVVLPAYQSAAQAVNTYTVSGVAVDTKGNRSDRSDTQVTVQAPEVNKQNSTFTPESSTLSADGKSTQVLTLTLQDDNKQPVDMDVKDISLKNSALKSAAVSALTRKSAGVYTVTVTAGSDNETVTLTPSVSGITLSPARVTITAAPELKDITVNGYTFAKDAGFPTTGFTGATFSLNLTTGYVSDYTWVADASWVSVANGVVKFTGTGTGNKVTITGTPTSGKGKIIKYSFMLKSWFINNGSTSANWTDANAYCSTQSGYSLPTVEQLTNDTWRGSGLDDQTRAVNAGLWSEWGRLASYPSAGFGNVYFWSSEQKSSGYHYLVYPMSGAVNLKDDSSMAAVVCREGF